MGKILYRNIFYYKEQLFLQLFNLGNAYALFLSLPLRRTRKVSDVVGCYKTEDIEMVKSKHVYKINS